MKQFTNGVKNGLELRVISLLVRAASNPRGIAAARIMGVRNNQPFSDGRFLFAHNGTLEIPDEIAARLGAYRKNLKSLNDSEVFFWQFVKFYDAGRDAGQALADCVGETRKEWRRCRGRYKHKAGPYTGLNAVVSDGASLHALSLYRSSRGVRSLGRGTQPWGTMSLRAEARRVVVSSEPFDGGRWRRLPPGTVVSAVPAGRRIAVRLRRVQEDAA